VLALIACTDSSLALSAASPGVLAEWVRALQAGVAPPASPSRREPPLGDRAVALDPSAIRSILVTAGGAPDEPGGEGDADAEGFHVGVIYARLSWTVARGHNAFEAMQTHFENTDPELADVLQHVLPSRLGAGQDERARLLQAYIEAVLSHCDKAIHVAALSALLSPAIGKIVDMSGRVQLRRRSHVRYAFQSRWVSVASERRSSESQAAPRHRVSLSRSVSLGRSEPSSSPTPAPSSPSDPSGSAGGSSLACALDHAAQAKLD
jgi:hypothetical protein